jgi:hypothetical protein
MKPHDTKDPIIQKWQQNYASNLRNGEFSKPDARPLMFLMNSKPYFNVPVVLITAGPSLDKNIQVLKNYQKNTIIFCVDVVLFKLLENDIIPDFVVNIDPSDMFVRFWEDLDTSKLTLICPTSIHPKALGAWKGRKFFYNQIDYKNTEKGKALKSLIRSTVGYGNIVNRFFIGATMTQIASIFNPKPFILLGYDFAFSDNKAYCNGLLDRKIFDDTLPTGSPEQIAHIQKMKTDEVVKEIEVSDIHGNKVFTTKTLKFYRDWYLRLIHHELKITYIINATEGGILVDIPSKKLQNALEDLCKNEIEKKDVFMLKQRQRRHKK